MAFPDHRPRRLRNRPGLRRLMRETRLSADRFIAPLFVRGGKGVRTEISAMPGQFQLSIDTLVDEVKSIRDLGIPAVILFGIPDKKDGRGSGAYLPTGIVQQALTALREKVPGIELIADICLCEYTDHGHCGVVTGAGNAAAFSVENDPTLEILAEASVSLARAGAHVLAPSGMMDGTVRTMRDALDREGFDQVPILAYAAKYASAFYGPFREAAESPPQFGDRATYQMDPANFREAVTEMRLDLEEGADILMVKPALAYLDVIAAARARFDVPIAAYNVSGEYSMIKAAARNGWLDERKAALESLTAIARAGADMILTYWAKDAARWLAGTA
ncbi:MAG: porphobilinogen synthase [Planctomycetes bacterium]|nr:porphobilinogen synthase [Planctomycetota bacterium]